MRHRKAGRQLRRTSEQKLALLRGLASSLIEQGAIETTEAKAKEAAAWLAEEKRLEECSIDLMDVLAGRGFPKTVFKKIIQEFGNRAAEIV